MNHDPRHPDDERKTPQREGDDEPREVYEDNNGPWNYWPMRGDV